MPSFGAGTDYDISATTVFRPSFTTCVLQSGTTWPVDQFGVCSMVRRWKCRRDLALRFMPRYGDTDFLFRRLKVIDVDPVDDGAITTLTVRYNGFIQPPKRTLVLERPSTKTLEVTLYPRQGDGSLNVVYLAPTLTRSWASEKPPEWASPFDFKGFNDRPEILFARDNRGINIEGNLDSLLELFNFKIRSVRTQNDSTPDGHVYRNLEVIERQIQQVEEIKDSGANLIGLVGALGQ